MVGVRGGITGSHLHHSSHPFYLTGHTYQRVGHLQVHFPYPVRACNVIAVSPRSALTSCPTHTAQAGSGRVKYHRRAQEVILRSVRWGEERDSPCAGKSTLRGQYMTSIILRGTIPVANQWRGDI